MKLFSLENKDASYTYTIGKCRFPSDFEVTAAIDRWIFFVVVGGRLRGMGRNMERGDWLFVPASTPHIITSGQGENPLYYWCTSNDPLPEQGMRAFGFSDRVLAGHMNRPETVSALFENTVYREIDAADRRMWFFGTVLRILACACGNGDSAIETVPLRLYERCVSYIAYCQGKVTVGELADKYHVSRQHLHHIFMRYGDISPQKCIMNAKMEAADKYLMTTDMSLAQISELMCYNNYNHFTQSYKKHFGILPSERRKQNEKPHLAKPEKTDGQDGQG